LVRRADAEIPPDDASARVRIFVGSPGARFQTTRMPHVLFLTGKLAEPSLRRTLADLAPRAGFEYSVEVLPITVAALATTPWIARHYTPSCTIDRIVLPGLCNGELDVLKQSWGDWAIEKGPDD